MAGDCLRRPPRTPRRLVNLPTATFMQPTPQSFTDRVVKALPGFFNDAFEQFRQGEGGYIANGMPEGPVAQVGQAVARAACRRYGSGNAGGMTPAQATRYEEACGPYLADLGSGPIGFANPYQGGQCPVILYTFRFTSTRSNGQVQERFIGGNPGPLGSWSLFVVGTAWIMRINHASGFNQQAIESSTLPKPTITNVRVTRDDNQPDNCGNPPPEIIPRGPFTDPLPPPFRFNPFDGIDIPINVDISPDGDITVDFGDGPTTVDPFPEEPGGGDGPVGGPGDTTNPGSPGPSSDTGGGGAAGGAAGAGEELVGLLVQVLESPEGANVFANNASQPFRGIGYIRMGYPNRLGLDISGGTVISPQFFHAQQRGLTDWAVSANLGFNLRTTPYYREITS